MAPASRVEMFFRRCLPAAAAVIAAGTIRGVYAQNGPSFELHTTALPTVPLRLHAGDQDGDGHLDVVMIAPGPATTVFISYGNGLGGATPPTSFSLGSSLAGSSLGDLNHDGVSDLVAGISLGSTGAIGSFLSAGTNGLTPVVPASLSAPPKAVILADLNGDGHKDLVCTPYNIGVSADAVMGDGAGNWIAQSNICPSGDYPALGDFNGDGNVDVTLFESPGSLLRVWLGTGGGTFQAGGSVSQAYSPFGCVVGDFDEDGKVDACFNPMFTPNLEVHHGDGAGGFSSATINAAGYGGFAGVTATDMNGDGHLDVAGKFGAASLGFVAGSGTGAFSSASSYMLGAFFLSAAFVDMNEDGRVDMVGSCAIPRILGVFLNGTPIPGVMPYGNGTPGCVGAHGFDVNGAPRLGTSGFEIRVTNAPPSSLGQGVLSDVPDPVGTDLFGVGALVHVVFPPTGVIIPFDILSDALGFAAFNAPIPPSSVLLGMKVYAQAFWQWPAPCATAVMGISSTPGLQLEVLDSLPAGAPAYAAAVTYPAGGDPRALRSVDLDADGRCELVVAGGSAGTVGVLSGFSGGLATSTWISVGGFPHALTAGMLDSDGNVDVAAARRDASSIQILRGDGWGGLTLAGNYSLAGAPTWLESVDVNGDGRNDLIATAEGPGHLYTLVGKTDGSFGVLNTSYTSVAPRQVAMSDIDGDGIVDASVACSGAGIALWMKGDGLGGFAPTGFAIGGTSPVALAAVDFSEDGIVDLVVADELGSTIWTSLGAGAGAFQAPSTIAIPGRPAAMVAGNWNADFHTDLAVACSDVSSVVFVPSAAIGAFGAPASYGIGVSPGAIAAGELGGSSYIDLVTANPAAGNLAVLRHP